MSKPSHEKKPGKLQPVQSPPVPGHTISIDFVTGLPEPKDEKNALLTITCKFSKAVILISCRDTTSAHDVACLYFERAYSTFGLPSKIISDRDARFTSGFWQALCKKLDIPLGLTAAYHPSADGQAERTNQTVENSLRCLLAADPDKYPTWTSYLPLLEHEFNSTIQSSTGFTPNELRFVVPPRSIPDALLSDEINNASAEKLTEDLLNKRDEARIAIHIAQAAQKDYVDKHRSDKQFEEGDLVLLKFQRFGLGYKPPKKHAHKFGPLATLVRIIKKISPLAYKVALPAGSRIHDVISILHLQKYGKDSGIRPLPIVNNDGGEEEWEVESIEGERTVKGKKEFLVRWRGYTDDEMSWEPISHLDHAQDRLLEWQLTHDSQKSSVKPNPRKKPPHDKPADRIDALYSHFHLSRSSQPKPAACEFCHTQFPSRNRLFMHLHSHQGEDVSGVENPSLNLAQ